METNYIDCAVFKKRFIELCLRSGLTEFPSKRRDQLIILKSIAIAFQEDREYSEVEINQGIKQWLADLHCFPGWDYMALRRQLVDECFLNRHRDGSGYRIHSPGPVGFTFDPAIAKVDIPLLLAEAQASIARKKAAYLQNAPTSGPAETGRRGGNDGQFKNKVAVITGAASGIGRALAQRCAQEGLNLVLADIEETALLKVEAELKTTGAATLAVVTDVAKEADMEELARKTLARYGSVHLLFNNAGVGAGALLWSSTVADWQWVINVNLWGAIHATRIFVPIMLQQRADGYIVNTASRAGLETGPTNGIYRVTKHALVSFSETLYHELKLVNAPIGVSVLCPGFVRTRICDAERNRPADLINPPGTEDHAPQGNIVDQMMRRSVASGMDPEEVAELTFAAIRQKRFYILPDPECKLAVQQRMEAILNEQNPSFLMPPSFAGPN